MANDSNDHPTDGAAALKTTPLADAHRAAGARMVPFAGYEMPLQYKGIIAEHQATRDSAGLFDVSHMGQIDVTGEGADQWLETLTPSDIVGLKEGGARYSVLTNAAGGIVDDLIITRLADRMRLVVNGARRDAVRAHLEAHAAEGVAFTFLDRALIALQGPQAEAVLAPHVAADLSALGFMQAVETEAFGVPALVARSGYTGEDGFEVSLPGAAVTGAFETLVADPRVAPVGLGARDTLRLEAGLCLYGQDLTEEISPVEADLLFVIAKRRRTEGGFVGAGRVLGELADGPARKRVGLAVDGRVPVRAGAVITSKGEPVGIVTSGGVGPTVGGPIAMGLVAGDCAALGTALEAQVRGRTIALTVAKLPFVPAAHQTKGMSMKRYTEEHEWLQIEGDVATVGISFHAQEALGDITFVELPEAGKTLAKGDSFAVVESVKAASDVYAPLAGEVVEINQALEANPQLLNEAPEGEGWLAKIRLTDTAGAADFMDKAAYDAFVAENG